MAQSFGNGTFAQPDQNQPQDTLAPYNSLESTNLPSRNSFSRLVRDTALKCAMALGSTGALTGGAAFLAATSEAEVAKGDFILSLDYDPAHQQRGVERSVAMRGNVGGVEYINNTGLTLASATMFNRNGRGFALSAGHVGVHSDFTFFTGWDAVNNRGLEYRPVNVDVFPGYSLGMNPLGNTLDLALFTFNTTIQGAPDLVFPDAPLGLGDSLTHGGFGTFGIWGQQPIGKDGIARAGTANLRGSSFLNGANSEGYFTANLSLTDPDSSVAATGSSGNPGQKSINNIMYTFGIVTQASNPPFGVRTQLVRTDKGNEAFHNWFDGATAVPEPSSLMMLAAGTLGFLLRRVLRRPLNNQQIDKE